MELEVFDDKVFDLVDESMPLEKLGSGFEMTEGPVYHEGVIYFTDWPASKIFTYDKGKITLINDNTYNTIGMTYDRKNDRILRCARELHAITDLNGNIIIDNYKGVRINGSNDVVADAQGRIYFSDPLSRVIQGEQIGHSSVFMYDENNKELTMLDGTLPRPNGLALSLDEKSLYIIDSYRYSLYKMDLATKKIEFFVHLDETMGEGAPDGMRLDARGNIYTTGPGGVWIIDPAGLVLGLIRMPENITNLCFDDRGIFITGKSSIYRLDTKIQAAESSKK
jgi:sugar lactone lactonase YvrE